MIQITEVSSPINVNVVAGSVQSINFQLTEVNESVSIEVAEMGIQGLQGLQGIQGGIIFKTAGEALNSHTPIAIYNGLAYKLDASNVLHQFAYVGFSKKSALAGQIIEIIQVGEIQLIGWNLSPNKQYLAGTAGALVLSNDSEINFTKVIGYAVDENTIQIIKDYITINK